MKEGFVSRVLCVLVMGCYTQVLQLVCVFDLATYHREKGELIVQF